MEESSFTIPADDNGDSELDPRIQVELEKLNAATDEINNLELELDESMKRFHVSLTETSRRLQALSKRLGTCVDRSRPYYEAVATAAAARADCQKAAIQFQRASELHAAAKETVTLAEQRFVSKQDEWQFDSNWQEVLNHAIIKVMEAEKRKAESGREHQKKAAAYIAAERKVNQLEDNLKRNIMKSRVYFDEKKICDEELQSQNEKIERLQKLIADAKFRYSTSLRALEEISDEIHRRRGDAPPGERSPGVGAEREPSADEHERGLAALRRRVRELALQPAPDDAWASELNDTIDKLDQLLLMKERGASAPASHARGPPGAGRAARAHSMMSLDVLALARDTLSERESYLKAVIEDKSPSGTYTESTSERNDSPDEVLTVECDSSDSAPPVIRLAGSAVSDSDNS